MSTVVKGGDESAAERVGIAIEVVCLILKVC